MSELPSYCVDCDTVANPCPEHPAARRYLDPIIYQHAEPDSWRTTEPELERWTHPPTERPRPADAGAARPIQRLIVDLEAWVFLSDQLESSVRAAYAINAQRTTRLVDRVVAGAREQTLERPDGYLAKHAAAIASPNIAAHHR